MTLHFINAKLIDPEAGDIITGTVHIADGKIAQISAADAPLPASAEVIDCKGKYLAPGIVDLGVKVCEPGERHKESYRSAGLAAAAGGVTTAPAPAAGHQHGRRHGGGQGRGMAAVRGFRRAV